MGTSMTAMDSLSDRTALEQQRVRMAQAAARQRAARLQAAREREEQRFNEPGLLTRLHAIAAMRETRTRASIAQVAARWDVPQLGNTQRQRPHR